MELWRLQRSPNFLAFWLDISSSLWHNTHMKEIQNTTVDRRELQSSPKGAVMGITQYPFLKVGKLYISMEKKHDAYSVSVKPFGNSCLVSADTPRGAACQVALDYEDFLSRCERVALPISQSYLDRFGTAME